MDIQFEFEDQRYTAPASFYDTNRFTLPDGRTIAAKTWFETMPPRPKGLHVVTPMPAVAAKLLGKAHAALAALRDLDAAMAEHNEDQVGEDIARPLVAIRSRLGGTADFIAARLPPVERTPEVVLRAMLRAYEAHHEALTVDYLRRTDEGLTPAQMRHEARASSEARSAVDDVRWMLFGVLAGKPCGAEPHVLADYEARLRGDRPIDAPPAEVP